MSRQPTRRRSPRFARFIVTGALVGFLVGAAIAVFTDPAASYSTASAIGYLGAMGAGIGALLAALVAVLLDRQP